MVSFFRNLFGWGPAKPRVCVAAFGKHPGWDDHLEVGVETELLATVKQTIYVDGIAGNIESGAWDKLAEDKRVRDFGHVFLWRRGLEIAAGRLWSSRDGKGRSRYPMVCVADCSGMPLRWVIEKVYPALERIESRCSQTDSESVVRDVISGEGKDLRALATSAAQVSAAPLPFETNVLRYLGDRLRGPDYSQLFSVLYQIDSESGGYRLGQASSSEDNNRPTQLRVPACADLPGEAALLWVRFLQTQFDDAAPLLVLQPLAGSWIDLIVGEPTTSQLYCMMASPAAVALTTDIPYKMPASFIERTRRLIGANNDGGTHVPNPMAG